MSDARLKTQILDRLLRQFMVAVADVIRCQTKSGGRPFVQFFGVLTDGGVAAS